ncbi:DUF2946 domain-containing protein [Pseudomonas sp. MM211]|uniref:DUF2946 family protein n=1 Tax=Pseudomonas sp. MM211 TaxID=2866808 RepID=UPI001CEDEF70|nr:DUF2946 family protein [Pseudomonas sp. MM211]UCJ18845.1 DUF2946 domain-containing protein [Pseudomonas sp. MM211]
MKFARDERSLIAWMLYASVLFSLFVCGIHHGQMSGLALSGLNGGYCASGSDHGQRYDDGSSSQSQQMSAQFNCPLCSSSSLAIALNTASWNIGHRLSARPSPIVVRSLAQPPPRYLWPSLNPRASPSRFLAV